MCNSGVCECDRGFSGKFCQYQGTAESITIYGIMIILLDECVNNSDCGGPDKGSCIDIDSTTFPTKQCFCNESYFGHNCSQSKDVINIIQYYYIYF